MADEGKSEWFGSGIGSPRLLKRHRKRRNFGDKAAIGKFLAVSATMAHRSYRLPVVDLEDFIDFF
jgi:hypothetical protein